MLSGKRIKVSIYMVVATTVLNEIPRILAKYKDVVDQLKQSFAAKPVDLERAKSLTIELQYLQNLDNAAKDWQPGKRVEITH
jgi:hypothetical protein